MAELFLANIAESTSDEEIGEFLIRYGFPRFSSIQRVEGTGSRPAAVVIFDEVSTEGLRVLQTRIHNLFWKNHTITAQLLPERDES